MKKLLTYIFTCLTLAISAQTKTIEGVEFGLDGFVGASTLGGSFGVGPKIGLRFNENLILGPSFRMQRTWSNNIGQKFGYTIFGGGMFLHGRFKNVLFGGFEFEMLKSPISYTVVNPSKTGFQVYLFAGDFRKNSTKLFD